MTGSPDEWTVVAELDEGAELHDVSFSPRGDWIATASRSDEELYVHGVGDWELATTVEGAGGAVEFLADGSGLVCDAVDPSGVRVVEATADWPERGEPETSGDRSRVVTTSPDGNWIATGGTGEAITLTHTDAALQSGTGD